MIIAKISKSIENLTSKKTQVVSRDHQTNSDLPAKFVRPRYLSPGTSVIMGDSILNGLLEENTALRWNKKISRSYCG